jgi:hypothetical protein
MSRLCIEVCVCKRSGTPAPGTKNSLSFGALRWAELALEKASSKDKAQSCPEEIQRLSFPGATKSVRTRKGKAFQLWDTNFVSFSGIFVSAYAV